MKVEACNEAVMQTKYKSPIGVEKQSNLKEGKGFQDVLDAEVDKLQASPKKECKVTPQDSLKALQVAYELCRKGF